MMDNRPNYIASFLSIKASLDESSKSIGELRVLKVNRCGLGKILITYM